MKINDLSLQTNSIAKKAGTQTKASKVSAEQKSEGDTLEISAAAQKVAALVVEATNASVLDKSRVESIKEMLSAGTYQVNSRTIAEKMLKNE